MKEDSTVVEFRQLDSFGDPLTEIARVGARRMLAEALKAEADAFVASLSDDLLPDDRQRVRPKVQGRHRRCRRHRNQRCLIRPHHPELCIARQHVSNAL
jgi:hypothetical protein